MFLLSKNLHSFWVYIYGICCPAPPCLMSSVGVPSKVASSGREKKNKLGSTSKRHVNILNAVIRSARIHSLCSLSSEGRWRMPLTNLVANLWIPSKWLIPATSFGEQTGIPYSGCGRTKASYNGMKADFEWSWKERLIMKISRLALVYRAGWRINQWICLTTLS